MKKLATMVLAAALCSTLLAAQYSKLGIVTAAKAAGKWEQVKAWIDANGYTDEWLAAAYFEDGYPLFAQVTNRVVASGLATVAEGEAFLAAARDTAPDALLSSAYAHDMRSGAGRARWHGGNPASEYRTNETTRIIERVDVYPDGWTFVDPASRRRALTPDEAAERAAKRRTARQARIEQLQTSIDAYRAQLAVPATNDELIVSQAHARLRIASLQRILDRLTAPASTNEVVITVVPPG